MKGRLFALFSITKQRKSFITIDKIPNVVYYCTRTLIQRKGMPMAWSFAPGRAVYIQVAERIRRWVITGQYGCGEQIPSVRQIALDAAVNPNTVQHAFTELESEGIIVSRGTLGRFVTEDIEIIKQARETEARRLVSEFALSATSLSLTLDEIVKLLKEKYDERS